MSDALSALRESRLVPVVTIHHPSEVEPIARGLADAGIRCIEITLRSALGLFAIRQIVEASILHVGAGTVLDEESLHAAVDAGAEFAVSPGLDEGIVAAARRRGVLALPGVATATEIQRARRSGLDHVKVFPIASIGGIGAIEALHQPFAGMSFMPSGGVTAQTANDFLAHPGVFAVGSSWLVPKRRDDSLYAEVRALAEDALHALDPEGEHA
ncbi:bifunctional 4-hydroxy-2-oxoglutarate aldolase/2-dehydro-3-deoxy-phosphogluconate aldolase [Microbacterium phyllosphaerae]|uniref:bifunctional 4-hydroxy-2-oxoglutarate aldolase/2-dehydro-3-deoxy-phosphogluconate aldolase n=1 Tax=Microbacterium phyllosphaerae TaxID=124798 RepID=UPI003D65CB81